MLLFFSVLILRSFLDWEESCGSLTSIANSGSIIEIAINIEQSPFLIMVIRESKGYIMSVRLLIPIELASLIIITLDKASKTPARM